MGRHRSVCEQPDRRGLHVLVVNDYADNVESMAMLLRLCGHEVDTALGGRAAVEAARANPPDVVLLDISMPGMDGYEVARQLRRTLGEKVRLIALTAYDSPEDQHWIDAGFNRHFIKPVNPIAVERLLRGLANSL
jgi:two-component system, chemotaxis family, CheB/CheR fusion protein